MERKTNIWIVVIVMGIFFFFSKLAFALSVQYQEEKTSVDGMSAISDVWVKNGNIRIETNLFGFVTITLLKGSDVYMYTKGQKTASKIDKVKDYFGIDRLDNYQEFLQEKNAKLLGEENIEGKSCNIYTYKESGMSIQIWVWKEKNFPVKYEKSSQYGTEKSIIKNIQLDPSISDDLFKLPPDMTVTEMKRPK